MLGEIEVLELSTMYKTGMGLKELSRKTGHSINTIRKYIRDKKTIGYVIKSSRVTKLEPYKIYLNIRIKEARPNWLPATVLFSEIKSMGYTGSISTLRNYLQYIKPVPETRPLVRFETSPGEQMQVDFAVFSYKKQRYYAFVAILGFSRQAFIKFVKNQQIDTLIDCHEEAFLYFEGVPKNILYDNMKTVILNRDVYGKGKHRLHQSFYDFAKHYGFVPRICQPYSPQTKGKVERLISYIRHIFYNPFIAGKDFINLDILNLAAINWLNDVANQRIHATTNEIPYKRWALEKPYLLNIPNNYSTNYGIINKALESKNHKYIMEQNTHSLQHKLSLYDSILSVGGIL